MSDWVTAIGLVLLIEGGLWAAAPHMAMRLLQSAAATPVEALRLIGLAVAAVGFAIVWSFGPG